MLEEGEVFAERYRIERLLGRANAVWSVTAPA
jgi:hypothetical protein